MDARDLLRSQHTIVHSQRVSGLKSPTLADRTFTAGDAEMRVRPAPGQNSLAWLLWHMARAEDVFVNVVFLGARQLYDEAWAGRVEPADMQRAAAVGALGQVAAAMTQFFVGQRRSVVLPSIVTLHNAEHIGEAMTVRSLGGFGLPV